MNTHTEEEKHTHTYTHTYSKMETKLHQTKAEEFILDLKKKKKKLSSVLKTEK